MAVARLMGHLRIGLTGGIGSGKSTVAAVLQSLGATIIDADVIARELTGPGGAAMSALRQEFGPSAIGADGGLDRAWMRAQAFSDPEARKRLEAIVHPQVRAESERQASAHAASAQYVVFVIPLLVEAGGWQHRVHRVLVIDCSEHTQFARVLQRPGIDAATARAILVVQSSRAARLAAADDVLFNEAPLDVLEPRIAQLHALYRQLAGMAAPLGSL
jgi:dephospho-CoA kinase